MSPSESVPPVASLSRKRRGEAIIGLNNATVRRQTIKKDLAPRRGGQRGAASALEMIFFDFDGVLTDNRVWVFDDGREGVVCSRADGQGFSLLRQRGVPCMIISTEENPVVSHRARKLELPAVQAVKHKGKAVLAICRSQGINPAHTAFVGNDVNDLPALAVVGYKLCPADAAGEVKQVCDHVLRVKGGEGVAREIATRYVELFL